MFRGHQPGSHNSFDAVQDGEDPFFPYRLLAEAMIIKAINDINDSQHRSGALRWVNDDREHVFSFGTVCDLAGRCARHLREQINRYAKDGMNIRQPRKAYRRTDKKINRCRFPGCGKPCEGYFCKTCYNIVYGRQQRHPDRLDLWLVPKHPAGGFRKLGDGHAKASLS